MTTDSLGRQSQVLGPIQPSVAERRRPLLPILEFIHGLGAFGHTVASVYCETDARAGFSFVATRSSNSLLF
jgi:isopentenyl phosphate kinase